MGVFSVNEYDRLAVEYANKLGEAFPIYGVAYGSEQELLEIMRKAIEDGKPVEPKYSDDTEVMY